MACFYLHAVHDQLINIYELFGHMVQELVVSKNYLTSAMPTEIGNLMKLRNLAVSDNLIEGKSKSLYNTSENPIHSCSFSLTSYLQMIFANSGQIPDELTGLWRLVQLNLQNNRKLWKIPCRLDEAYLHRLT